MFSLLAVEGSGSDDGFIGLKNSINSCCLSPLGGVGVTLVMMGVTRYATRIYLPKETNAKTQILVTWRK